MRRFGGSGAAPAAPANSGGDGHAEQKNGEQQGGGGGFGTKGFRPQGGGGFGSKKKFNMGRLNSSAFQSHAPAPPSTGPTDAEGTEATPACPPPVDEPPAPEAIVAPAQPPTLKRKSPAEAMPKPTPGPSATVPATITSAPDRPMSTTAVSAVPRPPAALRPASPSFPAPAAPVHIRERALPQATGENAQARSSGDGPSASRSAPAAPPRPRPAASSRSVPPGEAGTNRFEAANGTRFSGETVRSASPLRKQAMPPPDALNTNITNLDDAGTQNLVGGEDTSYVMETSYEDDLEQMDMEMEGQNTGDYVMTIMEPPDEIEAEYEAKTAENVEQRRELQDQIDKLRPALTEEIFKVHKLHFSVLQSDATLEIERAITELREIITEARNTYCSGVAMVS